MNDNAIRRRIAPRPRCRSWGPATAAVVFVATVIGFDGPARGQTQVIPLRSGNGPIGGPDADIRVLGDGSPGDLTAAWAAPSAIVRGPLDDGVTNLLTDPAARWIGPAPDLKGGGQTILYAIPFTVNAGPMASADLQFVARGKGLPVDGVVAELRLNGRPIGEVPFAAPGAADEWYVLDGLAPLLTAGVNWLYMSVPYSDLGGGLIFSARLGIWRRTEAPESAGTPFTDGAAGVASELATAEAGGICTGFTCRPRGDLDSDHDVDVEDYTFFAGCFSGVETAPPDDCEYADFDCDGDVDLIDAGFFQTAFSGSW